MILKQARRDCRRRVPMCPSSGVRMYGGYPSLRSSGSIPAVKNYRIGTGRRFAGVVRSFTRLPRNGERPRVNTGALRSLVLPSRAPPSQAESGLAAPSPALPSRAQPRTGIHSDASSPVAPSPGASISDGLVYRELRTKSAMPRTTHCRMAVT
jgi:hypothetical protein